MKTLYEPLASAQELSEKKKSHIFHSSEISRIDRQLLLRHQWLEEIIKGWYLLKRPDLPPGESTAWHASFWDFIKLYLESRYGDEYCLSAESSIDFHLGNPIISKQIVVIASRGAGRALELPHHNSLYVYADPKRLPLERQVVRGLQVMPLELALCRVSPTYFELHPEEAEIALRSVVAWGLLKMLAVYPSKAAAGRLLGAYHFLKEQKIYQELKRGLEVTDLFVKESNPFVQEKPLLASHAKQEPHTLRIYAMWEKMREKVIANFPKKKRGKALTIEEYLKTVTEAYSQDAYNSLSIEGYHVTKGLIEKVRNAEWNPDNNSEDNDRKDALAARGYFEGFQVVKDSIRKVMLAREMAGQIVADELSVCYQKLFSPCVQAGIISVPDLFGYRCHQVYIRNSKHVPFAPEYLGAAMEALFNCLKIEKHPAVRAVLGHFIFVYIHPFMDGNGRIGRFLMNVMLASGGYPWIIIRVANRSEYMAALEAASVDGNIVPFTTFVANEMALF